jgi:hypothetical protein
MTALLDSSAAWRLWRALRPVPEGNSTRGETMDNAIATRQRLERLFLSISRRLCLPHASV